MDGNKFADVEGFFNGMERLLTAGLDWKMGRNLNALNDVLRGGFGVHGYEEPVEISWINFSKSEDS